MEYILGNGWDARIKIYRGPATWLSKGDKDDDLDQTVVAYKGLLRKYERTAMYSYAIFDRRSTKHYRPAWIQNPRRMIKKSISQNTKKEIKQEYSEKIHYSFINLKYIFFPLLNNQH
jgi:hypothetical protein